MMLDYCGAQDAALAVERAVAEAVRTRTGTADIGGSLGTRETGNRISAAVRNSATARKHEPSH
jgi:isocitrate/isopropylmalate dehydrogenase